MRLRAIFGLMCGVLIAVLIPLGSSLAQSVQTQPVTTPAYTFHIPVDEISFRFHASNQSGKPLSQLTVHDLKLSDNGKPQNQIMTLERLDDLPIRLGVLFDVSASVLKGLDFDRSIVQIYASHLLRKGFDQAFVMQFDTQTLLIQNWTGAGSAMEAGVAAIGPRANRYDPLTSIFDSLYTTCRDQWEGQSDATGNFILLFTDGEDNASHAYLSEAIDMCQRRHVAIYIFESSQSSHKSDGYKTVNDLASKTGGRVFFHHRKEDIWQDLQTIEEEQRYQYLLAYKPSEFKADGSFHRIRLDCNIPGARIAIRSGYYAFPRP